MKPVPLLPAGLIVSSRRAVIFAALIFLTALTLQADAPPTTLRIQNTGLDIEGLQTFQLEWDAISNATYLVQSGNFGDTPGLSGGDMVWKTTDAITPTDSLGKVVIRVTPRDAEGAGQPGATFFRLILPQPEIYAVEPAVMSPGTPVDLYVIGQCFGSNDVLRINGVPQTNVVFNSSTLLTRPTFTPATPGTYVFELVVSGQVRSSFNVTCADALSAPELVLQGPPEDPPASPCAVLKAKTKSNQSNDRVGGNVGISESVPDTRLHASGNIAAVLNGNTVIGGLRRPPAAEPRAAGLRHSVFLATGEVREQVVDLAVPGRGLDFIWARTYNSRIGLQTSQGGHWSHSYDVHLQPLGGDILIHDGTGRRDLFRLQTNGTYTCPEFFREGTLTGGVFRLTFADTGYWEFNPLVGSATDGKLAKIVDRNGNTMSLNYDGSGLLSQIVDDLDRTNTVAYNTDGRVAGVTDFSGRTVTYQYYHGLPGEPGGAGDLASVTSPPVTGTPNGNDFPSGKTTSYTYSTGYVDDRENHLLLSVIDANGQTVCTHVYQHNQTDFEFLHCISMQRWTNTPAQFRYIPHPINPASGYAVVRCIVNDPAGNVTECFYDARNRLVRLEEFTGRATPGVPVTDTVNRPTGKLRAGDPDSYITQWSWNNDSFCTKLRLPTGNSQEGIYESDFDKTTPPRKRGDLRVLRELACCGGADTDGDGENNLTVRTWQFTYDSRFGTSEDSDFLGLKEYNPAKEYLVGDSVIYNGWIYQAGLINNMRDRLDALETRLQAFGLLASARGPRQTTSVDGSYSHGTGLSIRGADGSNLLLGKAASDFLVSTTDPRGNVATGEYDDHGNLREQVVAFNGGSGVEVRATTSRRYSSFGELTAVTNAPDANGRRRVDEYLRNNGFVVECIVDAGPGGLRLTNKFDRDVRGNVTRCVDARGNDWLYTCNALDQCVRVQTPTNLTARAVTDFFYDENDNLFTVTGTVRDRFDNPVLDQVNRFRYDPLHRLTRVECAVDATHSLTNDLIYDGNDQCVLVRGGDAVSGADPHQTVSYQYDERGLLFRESSAPGSPAQSTTQLDYDPNSNLTRLSEGLEGTPSTTTMEYDGFAGFGSSSPQIQGRFRAATPGTIENTCSSSQIAGRTGLRAQGPTPLAGSVRTARISKITDPLGNQTIFNFDANDNLKVIRHFGQTNDVPGTNGNIRLAESRYEYDGLDRRVRARDSFFNLSTQAPIGDGERTTTFAYAPNGQCANVTDDLGRVTSYTYDSVGWPAAVSSSGEKTVLVTVRDRAGNIVLSAQTDLSDLGGAPQVFSCTNVHDSLNRRVSSTDNVGNNENWHFDSLSRVVTTTDPRGNHSFYQYDLLGRQTLAVRDLDGDGVPELTTDYSERATWSTSNGRLLATTDSHDNITSYAYDSLGRCTSVTNADGTRLSLVWSPSSNLISEQDANGTVVVHTYDLNDRCISNNIIPGSGVASTTTFETFAYDGCSRLVAATNDVSHSEFEHDSLGGVPGNHRDGWNVLSAYDSVGRRTSLTYPGGRVLTYAYDALDQCTNILESGSSLASFSYDGPGRVARVTYANGMRTRIFYDGISGTPNAAGDFGHGQVSRIRHAVAGASPVVNEVSLAWDRNGNKISRDDAIFAPAIPRTNAMTLEYDAADQLTGATVLSGSTLLRDTTYGFDRMGNRSNVTGAASCSGSYFMDALVPGPMDFQMNQYTTTPCDSRSYDENGNLVSRSPATGPVTYQYDYAGRLVLVQAFDSGTGTLAPVASYAYDALGRRISKTVSGSSGLPPVTTEFFYDGASVIEEHENGLVTATFVLDGTRSSDDEVVKTWTWKQVSGPITMRRGGQDYYFHTDDLGNVLALTTTGGAVAERYDYEDYGAVTFLTSDGVATSATSSSLGNVYLFGGLRLDAETGLHNDDGGGYLEATTGRYLLRAGIPLRSDASTATYAGNNPWSGGGGSPTAMKSGTVKFFNEAKGFGRVTGGGGGLIQADSITISVKLINPVAMDKGLRFAIVSRDTLKTYFETGDVPTQNQGRLPRNVLKSFFQTGNKPTQVQFGSLIDSLRIVSGGARRIDLVTRVVR